MTWVPGYVRKSPMINILQVLVIIPNISYWLLQCGGCNIWGVQFLVIEYHKMYCLWVCWSCTVKLLLVYLAHPGYSGEGWVHSSWTVVNQRFTCSLSKHHIIQKNNLKSSCIRNLEGTLSFAITPSQTNTTVFVFISSFRAYQCATEKKSSRINTGVDRRKRLYFINVAESFHTICYYAYHFSPCGKMFPELEKAPLNLLQLVHIISTKKSHEQLHDPHPEWPQSYFTSSRKQSRKVTVMTPGSMINYSPERPFR